MELSKSTVTKNEYKNMQKENREKYASLITNKIYLEGELARLKEKLITFEEKKGKRKKSTKETNKSS